VKSVRGVRDAQPMYWPVAVRIAFSGMAWVWEKNAAVRASTVGIERREALEFRWVAAQISAISSV